MKNRYWQAVRVDHNFDGALLLLGPMDDALTGSGLPHRRDHSDFLEQPDAAPAPCPACGSPRVIPVLYGSPSSELIAAYAAGRIAIGGAGAAEGCLRWECRDCDHRWADAAPGTFS
jgi:hypothetical protein